MTNHHKPASFPESYQDGCNRRFKPNYYDGKPWLVYSANLDAAYCIPCVLFADEPERHNLQALVNTPFRRWSRSKIIKDHGGKKYHISAMIKSKAFITTVDRPATKITNVLDNRRLQNIEHNRDMLRHIINVIVYLTKQGMPLRGHDESVDSRNRGNFLELIEVVAKYEPELKEHLKKHQKTSYISPSSQNELITVIGHECIRSKLVSEISSSKFFSLICDEASSHRQEFLSLIIRFVDETNTIREEFVGFHPVLKCTGQILAEQIIERLYSLGIDIEKCRGQGYDGAAAMSSDRCGVQAVIRERAPAAAYVHCASHCLNLVITHSCKERAISTMMDKVSKVCMNNIFSALHLQSDVF